jgi:sterol desaturase/sphingolipid hydroxylase (fatty acid hydroxylase superfamily)
MDLVVQHLRAVAIAIAPVAYCFLVIAAVTKRGALMAAFRKAWPESRTNAGLFAINYVLFMPIIAAPVLAVTTVVPNWQELRDAWPDLPFAVEVFLALALIDVTAYWRHRFEHTSFMWRFHATHHADETLNWFSVKRKHPIGKLFEVMIDIVPALLIGCPLLAIALAQMLRGWWGYLIHADVPWTLGPLGSVLISPAAHRLHHIRDEALMGANYGNTFAVWDRVFGTWRDPAPYLGCETGIAEGSRGVLGELFRPWSMPSPRGDAAFVKLSERPAGECVDGALENDRGGVAVDHLGALAPAGVLREQVALRAQGRPAFVPQEHGQAECGRQVAGVGAAGLGARAFAAIHVAGQAEDEAGNGPCLRQIAQLRGVVGEPATGERLACRGEAPAGIAGRDTDRLGAEVQPQQRAAAG